MNFFATKEAEKHQQGWYVDVVLQYESLSTDDDSLFGVLTSFDDFSVVGSFNKEKQQFSLSMFINEESLLKSLNKLTELLEKNPNTMSAKIVEVELKTEEKREEEVSSPQIPELVSYAEIGKICGVSRQRARTLALEKEDFPKPLIETKQGPLYNKFSVISWNSTRNKVSGRPTSK